ncbi:MAG: hypothetical protein M3Y08_18395 [Fibrobacterota bacterium]|nr:hypothetical protein [Fibrobacterota bacterium]
MEKISIRQTYTQVSLYARISTTEGTKKNGVAGGAAPNDGNACPPKGDECARSKDGDTFTLSIEARSLQVSQTITIETDDAAGKSGRNGEAERLGGGFVNALLDAMDKADGKHRKPRHQFPELTDPEDVASKVLEQLNRDHADQGGTRLDFADAVKKRLADWKPSAARISVEYQEFRSQVNMAISGGLDAWASEGNSEPTF